MECISVQRRDVAVKPKKLRRTGVIPAVVFGKAVPESISYPTGREDRAPADSYQAGGQQA